MGYSQIYINEDTLPNTPVALLRYALQCMDEAKKQRNTVFRASMFHRYEYGKPLQDGEAPPCYMCAAGSIIHKLRPKADGVLPDAFGKTIADKLWFVSDIAVNIPTSALYALMTVFDLKWDNTKHSMPKLGNISSFNLSAEEQEKIMRDNIEKTINVLEGYGFP